MRLPATIVLMLTAVTAGCFRMASGSSMNREAAQQLSDSYMSDLVADRVDLALDKMDPQFIQTAGGKEKAEATLRGLFDYCGRPLNRELRHDEVGSFLYSDGREPAPMRAFYYSGKTTQHEKGFCFFAVRVVPYQNAMKVVNFGPLKLISGQLPPWAR